MLRVAAVCLMNQRCNGLSMLEQSVFFLAVVYQWGCMSLNAC